MKVIVDQNLCVGCGHCADLCPEVFEIKEDRKSHVVDKNTESCDIDQAIAECPVGAISKKE